MNKVINFENLELGAKIRVVENGQGEPLWVAKDVAEALGYTWKGSSGTISHVPEEWKGIWTVQIPLGSQEMAVLTEQGLYFFLGRSDKPTALPFQKWIAGEVLPSIRKTGKYEAPKEPAIDPETKIRMQYKAWVTIESETLDILGFDRGWMRAEAIERAVKIAQVTGVDVLPRTLITNPNANELTWTRDPEVRLEYARGVSTGANYINTTKWAEEYNLITPRHLNVILERLGLQKRLCDKAGMYTPSESGKLFAGTATISGKAKYAGLQRITGWNVADRRLTDLIIPEIVYLEAQLSQN